MFARLWKMYRAGGVCQHVQNPKISTSSKRREGEIIMSRQCQICSNPKLEEIENDINSGTMSIRAIARLHNLQHDALQRHTTQHMGVADTTEVTSGSSEFDTLAEIDYLYHKNRAALVASKNPVQCQKLIQQQITLMEMRKEYEKEKGTINVVRDNIFLIDPKKLSDSALFELLEQCGCSAPPDLSHE